MLAVTRWRRFLLLSICIVANIVVGLSVVSTLLALTPSGEEGENRGQPSASVRPRPSQTLSHDSSTPETRREDPNGRLRQHDDLTQRFLLEPAEAVDGRYCQYSPVLLIVVCSAVENVDRRKAIRVTWGDSALLSAAGARLVFFVALTDPARSPPGIQERVVDEHRRHDDVVQTDFIDDYVNLTTKTMASLRWATRACSRVRYVMKSDDDVYVNVTALMSRLELERRTQTSTFGVEEASATSFIIGQVVDSARPVRDRRSKWYTPTSIYPGEFYPPYASGTGYALGSSVVRRLVDLYDGQSRSNFGRVFWLEDVYVTGMLAASLPDVRLVLDTRFNFRLTQRRRRLGLDGSLQMESTVDSEACAYRNAISVHDLTPSELNSLWKRLQLTSDCVSSHYEGPGQTDSSNYDDELYS